MLKKRKIKHTIIIGKRLVQRFLDDHSAISKAAFQRECEVSNIIGHLQKPNEFSERIRMKIGTVAIQYGYMDWMKEKNIQDHDGILTNIYEVAA